MKTLLMRAYELKSYQIAGPAWMDSERYEIAAKIPAGSTPREVPFLLRTLLAERFHLVAHNETRQLSIYELAIAKSGPKFGRFSSTFHGSSSTQYCVSQ